MAVLGDVRVELLGRGAEAFVIGLGFEGDGAVRDEQRTGLQEVAVRPLGRLNARGCRTAYTVVVSPSSRD